MSAWVAGNEITLNYEAKITASPRDFYFLHAELAVVSQAVCSRLIPVNTVVSGKQEGVGFLYFRFLRETIVSPS